MKLDETNLLLEEYKDVSSNLGHYAGHSVAWLGLFLVATGALLAALYGHPESLNPFITFLLRFFGFVFSFVFWVCTCSSYHVWVRLLSRAIEIERRLYFKQYRRIIMVPKCWTRHWTFLLLDRVSFFLIKKKFIQRRFIFRPSFLFMNIMYVAALAFWGLSLASSFIHLLIAMGILFAKLNSSC